MPYTASIRRSARGCSACFQRGGRCNKIWYCKIAVCYFKVIGTLGRKKLVQRYKHKKWNFDGYAIYLLSVPYLKWRKLLKLRNQSMKYRKMIWIFPLLICGMIFFLSLQNSEDTIAISHYVQETVKNGIRVKPVNPDTSWIYNIAKFRKLAHIPEYLILGVSVAISNLFTGNKKTMHVLLKSMVLCNIVSVFDQTIKFLFPGREFDLTDIGFDWIGYFCGSVLVIIAYSFLGKTDILKRKKKA